jgi:hypothetical protein
MDLDTAFWQGFVGNAAATFLGVLFGIPFALWVNRRILRQQESKEAAERQNTLTRRKNQFLHLLQEALQKNLDLVKQMEQELKPGGGVYYNVDTQLLESTSSLKYGIIEDLDLNRRLDSIRYELLHLHRKVEIQLDIAYSTYRAMDHYREQRAQLIGAITMHFPRIKQEITEALAIIEGALRSETSVR